MILVTCCRFEITPRCQQVHGSLRDAMMEAAQRCADRMEEADKRECNAGAHYHVIVKLERKSG